MPRVQPLQQVAHEHCQVELFELVLGGARECQHRFNQLCQAIAILHQAFNRILVGVVLRQVHRQELQTGADVVDRVAHLVCKDCRHLAQHGLVLKLLVVHSKLFLLGQILDEDQDVFNALFVEGWEDAHLRLEGIAVATIQMHLSQVVGGAALLGGRQGRREHLGPNQDLLGFLATRLITAKAQHHLSNRVHPDDPQVAREQHQALVGMLFDCSGHSLLA